MKKEGKENKIIFICYIIASLGFYISSIINIIGEQTKSMGIVYLGLGTTFLCLSTIYYKKYKDTKNKG